MKLELCLWDLYLIQISMLQILTQQVLIYINVSTHISILISEAGGLLCQVEDSSLLVITYEMGAHPGTSRGSQESFLFL